VVLRHPDRILSVCYAVLFNLDIDFFGISMIRKADTGVSNVPNAQLEIVNIWRSQMRIFKHAALAGALSLSMLGASVAQAKDIVDTAVSAGSFETLVAAVKAAGLVDTLKGSGPFTVFAPTDEAFAALPAGTVEELLKPENKDQLVKILTYHVIPGKVMASDVKGQAGRRWHRRRRRPLCQRAFRQGRHGRAHADLRRFHAVNRNQSRHRDGQRCHPCYRQGVDP
jgi:uncharacterized surface protein with fasciclin (FAS1) repeats